jgi:DNA-binding GntR family transcriptional regulator
VKIPTRQDLRGHYVVREALEVQAAMLFAESATPEERTELLRLAARVDAMSIEPESDRFVHLTLHEKLHRRIAECARCPFLSEAIEKTHALALTWLCVARPASPDRVPRKHQKLIEALSTGDPSLAAQAMRKHVAGSMLNAMQRLEPYFRLAKTQGDTYSRTTKK